MKRKILDNFVFILLAFVLLFTIFGGWEVKLKPSGELAESQTKVLTIGFARVSADTLTLDYTCNGTSANNTAEFQAALGILTASGGGKLEIRRAGNYAFTITLDITDNITIEGVGQGTYLYIDGSTTVLDVGTSDGCVFRDFATDAGGIDIDTATKWVEENITISSTYYAYRTSSDITAVSVDMPVGRSATYIVAGLDAPDQVKAQADYVCDNTSDQEEIQTALNALTAGRTKKEKVLLIGTLSVGYTSGAGCINVPSYTILEIQGKIYLQNTTSDVPIISNSDTSGGNTGVEVFGGEIDGNKTNQVAGANQAGVQFNKADHSSVHDMYIHDTYRDGVYNVHSANYNSIFNMKVKNILGHSVFVGYTCSYVTVDGIISEAPNLEHICLEFPDDPANYNSYISISNVVGYNANNQGIYIQHSNHVTINNCQIYNTSQGAVYVNKSYYVTLTNVEAVRTTSAWREPFEVVSPCSDVLLSNCIAKDSSYGQADGSGFHLWGTNIVLSNSKTIGCQEPIDFDQTKSINVLVTGCQFTQYSKPIYIYGTDIAFINNVWASQNATPARLIYIYNTATGVRITGNDLDETVSTAILTVEAGGAAPLIKDNVGYITESSGSATITAAATTVVVTHGLSTTPTRVFISPTLLSLSNKAWVTSAGSSNFTINVDIAPGAGTATFDWWAKVGDK